MPSMNDRPTPPIDRREFLKVMGASMAMAALAGCRNRMPPEEILAYRNTPPGMILGEPRFYATTFPCAGFVQGLLVESHEGRPTKIEGNPLHPASAGATGIFAQASILDLYSPYRLKRIAKKNTGELSWSAFSNALKNRMDQHRGTHGRGLAILTGAVTSPTLRSQLESLLSRYPEALWRTYEPIHQDSVYEGSRRATGQALIPHPDFSKADRVVSFDFDFMGMEPNAVAHARSYMSRRRQGPSPNRLYVFEPGVTITGTKADFRWPVPSFRFDEIIGRLQNKLSRTSAPTRAPASARTQLESSISSLAEDLRSHRGRSWIAAGFAQSPEIHRKVYELNAQLGNIGQTVNYKPPLHSSFMDQVPSLTDLVEAMRSGRVQTLLILGGNPAYNAPRDLDFADALTRVPFKAHLTSFECETSQACDWVLPESHFLESWSDAESFDGTLSLIQPLITPLYSTVSAHDVLNLMNGFETSSPLETLRSYWRRTWDGRVEGSDFETKWKAALQDGVIPAAWTPSPKKSPDVQKHLQRPIKRNTTSGPSGPSEKRTPASSFESEFKTGPQTEPKAEPMELIVRPDSTVWDGRFSENPWLQELPKPPSQLTWDNALYVSPRRASRLKITNGDVLTVTTSHAEIQAAAFILQGLPDDSMTLSLGYGRKQAGPVARGSGFDAFTVHRTDQPWNVSVLKVAKTGIHYELASTQRTDEFGHRGLIETTRAEDLKDLKAPPASRKLGFSKTDSAYQWAMSIDIDSCIGCSACVVACQSENNIPVVGKRMVMMGREMHWIRIDRYIPTMDTSEAEKFHGATVPQPVTCMQCEMAPCEVVCPVAATVHSADGLNQQVYNRCVGTRYCSNNCPYKVRRFNFFAFSKTSHETVKMQRNPDVTVRSRGVMEKCTYCVQRIQEARIKSEKENREIRDGEILTACQQVCPTEAIVFGNLMDSNSRIVKTRISGRAYGLLEELGTKPRTTYLTRILNRYPSAPEET